MELLPSEVVLHVLVVLADGRQVARSCSLVCRQWAGLSTEPALWKALVHRFLGATATLPQAAGGRWKEAYFGLTRRLHGTLKIVGHLNSQSRAVADVLQEQSALDSCHLARPQYARMGFRMTEVDLASPDCRLLVVDVMETSSGPHFWPTFIGGGCAVLFLSHLYSTRAVRQLASHCYVAGTQHLIVVIEKWQGGDVDSFKAEVEKCFKRRAIRGRNVQYLVHDPKDESPLRQTIMETIRDMPISRDPSVRYDVQSVKPLRVVVREVKLRPGRQALMLGYVLSGNLRVGDELTIAPLGVKDVRVLSIERCQRQVGAAYGPDDHIGICVQFGSTSFQGLSNTYSPSHVQWLKEKFMRPGIVLGHPDTFPHAGRRIKSFTARVLVQEVPRPIRDSYVGVLRAHTASFECEWKITQIERSLELGSRRGGLVTLTPRAPCYLEPGKEGVLGRFLIRENREVVLLGEVMEIEWAGDDPALMYLQLRKQIPSFQQHIRGLLKVLVLDGYVEHAKNVRVVLAVKGDMHWAPSYYPKKTRTDDCPDWHQSFSFDEIDPRRSFLWVSMEEKSPSRHCRTIGEAGLHLGSLLTTSPQRRRVIHLNNYDKHRTVVRLTLSWQAS